MANEAKPCPCDIGDKLEYGGRGHEEQIGDVKAYVVKPTESSEKAIVVIQDIFGWQLPNTRYMADFFASNGYIAVCPDCFVGKEPWNPANDRSKFQEWLADKKPTEIIAVMGTVLRYLKEKCGVKRIGAVGFCWGGVVTHQLTLQFAELRAGVSAYGIIREHEDRYELKAPTLFIFGEKDTVIPLDQVATLEKNLQEKCKVDTQVKIYPGQTHGFVHRKREDINPDDRLHIQEARQDMLNWLNKYM